ncbi:MAG TPA: hypothetical protein VLA36_10690 [Longimicrobiales bacterium]|nr:hypothetical protein [Longimicrobiales bacterium]
MTRLIATPPVRGAFLLIVSVLSGCAAGPRAITRYPLSVRTATVVVDGAEQSLALDGNAVIDGVVRFAVDASQAGMILTVQNLGTEARSVVWDDASLKRDEGGHRRFEVGSDARIHATRGGETDYMTVSGPLFRQELPVGGTVKAYAPPQAVIPSPEKGCDAIMGTEFRLRVPVESAGVTRHYTFVLQPEWYDAWRTAGLEGRLRCGPVPDAPSWDLARASSLSMVRLRPVPYHGGLTAPDVRRPRLRSRP